MKYYFIGIKGSGMSALASVLFDRGNEIAGCDTTDFIFTQKSLDQKGIKIDSFEQAKPTDIDIFIVGNAFRENSELIESISQNSPNSLKISYIDYLTKLSVENSSYAIAGSHGKTTTTGLLAATLDKTSSIAYLIGDGTGKSELDAKTFVFEACEYKGHFNAYKPDVAIITNIDFDHPDYFTDLAHVQQEFQVFSANVNTLIINADDANSKIKFQSSKIITFGIENKADYQAINIVASENGYTFDLVAEDKTIKFHLPFFGMHMIYNSLSVIAAARIEGLSFEQIQSSILTFQGVDRRFTQHTLSNGAIIIDDYAHHPMEIKATINSVRQKYPTKKVVAVHQPHTFSRTTALLNEFGEAFSMADESYILPIWGSVREGSNTETITENDLIKLIKNGKQYEYNKVSDLVNQNNVILFMSASNVQPIINQLIEENNE